MPGAAEPAGCPSGSGASGPAVARLNHLDEGALGAALLRCCGSSQWVRQVSSRHPFSDEASLRQIADEVWASLESADWLEAFVHHPRIGGKVGGEAGPDMRAWASREQAGMDHAPDDVARRLAQANDVYYDRSGYVFLICATGKSAEEMLTALTRRMNNTPEVELTIAAEQQRQITQLRLGKLLAEQCAAAITEIAE